MPTLFVLVTLTFFLLRLTPGGPFQTERAILPEIKRNLDAYYGLDLPLFEQYRRYVWNITPKKFRPDLLFSGDYQGQRIFNLKEAFGMDFGPSYKNSSRSVNEIIAQKFPVSLELGAWSMLVALSLGIPAGVIAALRPNSLYDYVPSSLAMTGICIPTFVIGPLLVLVFAIYLRWLPSSGWYPWSEMGGVDRILPALTLGGVYAAYIARLTRAGMRDVFSQDFIRTARAKGVPEHQIVFRHALKAGLLPVVSFLGPGLAGILTGSFVIEQIFQIPGLGYDFITSAFNRDYTLVVGTVILYAVLIILFNLLVDIAVVWLNPRLRAH